MRHPAGEGRIEEGEESPRVDPTRGAPGKPLPMESRLRQGFGGQAYTHAPETIVEIRPCALGA